MLRLCPSSPNRPASLPDAGADRDGPLSLLHCAVRAVHTVSAGGPEAVPASLSVPSARLGGGCRPARPAGWRRPRTRTAAKAHAQKGSGRNGPFPAQSWR